MIEPESTAAGFALSKAAAALAGLFGGLSVSFFWQPKKLHQHGKLAAGAIIGGMAVSAAFTLGGMIARWLGLNFNDVDTALGLGYIIGILCVGIIAWLANFLERRENKDILEVVQEVRSAASGNSDAVKSRQPRNKNQ
ncbi:hypothetical protein UFOVP581_33 [uncultured Caudovirales phage]|uniref:Uncharacterized protein n=1 Tax=uncultured Caudovirales phage TaxID=2100421 RepID=A0A6J5PAT6_9CAUD|nr:hypothetical protein UFOVP581_33 [uncultured Caudovirales phage]